MRVDDVGWGVVGTERVERWYISEVRSHSA